MTTAYTYGKRSDSKLTVATVTINSTVGGPGGLHWRRYSTELCHSRVRSQAHVREQHHLRTAFGKGKPLLTSGVGSQLLGGLQVSPVLTAMTGLPLVLAARSPKRSGKQQVPKPQRNLRVLHGLARSSVVRHQRICGGS